MTCLTTVVVVVVDVYSVCRPLDGVVDCWHYVELMSEVNSVVVVVDVTVLMKSN